MIKSFLPLTILSALALTACATATTQDIVKLNGIGLNLSPQTGVTAGQLSATVSRTPVVMPKNSTQMVLNTGCGGQNNDDYSNLNSKATATASNVPVAGAAAAAAASAAGISSPSVAIATGDVAAHGCAAIVAAAATSAHPADVVATALNHSELPNAPAGSVVRDGVAPSPAAPNPGSTTPQATSTVSSAGGGSVTTSK